ncbi:fumarylacetoacetate hydrolase family protein [Amycolatopsis pithecellobii]|nr:fumarylacetoacetate hydrolase family protein [Amycolatopsis pithecellobii]
MPAFGIANIVVDATPTVAVLAGEMVYPLRRLVGADAPDAFAGVLADWSAWIDTIAEALAQHPAPSGLPAEEVEFGPAGLGRPTIWCAGANFTDHVEELMPQPPADFAERAFHFLAQPGVLSGHRGVVERPAGVQKFDWEVELTAVIGRRARRVSPEDALDYVAGYTVANDLSVRDPGLLRHSIFGVDWTASKNADGSTPVGPAVVPARFIDDPSNLDLGLTVNGEVRQKSNTAKMIIGLRAQIAALSASVTLEPGDLVLTGTPAGTAAAHNDAYLVPGDVVVAYVEGLGSLQTTIA